MLQPHQRRPLLIAATIVLAAIFGFSLMPKVEKSSPGDIMSYDAKPAVTDETAAGDEAAPADEDAAEAGAVEAAPEEPVKTPEQLATAQIEEQGKKGCEFDTLVGLPFSEALIAKADRPYRLIRPGDAVAEGESDKTRINLWLDKDGNIEKVTCE